MAATMEPETRRDPGAKTPPPAPRLTEAAKPGGRRRTAFVIMGVVLVALAALGARRWIFSLSHQSTDDAQVDGHIVPILPKVGGFVTEIRVDENQRVRVGDTLIVLDDRDYKVRLAQAEADLAGGPPGPPAAPRGAGHSVPIRPRGGGWGPETGEEETRGVGGGAPRCGPAAGNKKVGWAGGEPAGGGAPPGLPTRPREPRAGPTARS